MARVQNEGDAKTPALPSLPLRPHLGPVFQMSGEEGGAGLPRLSNHISAARQLAQAERGKRLDEERADAIAAFLRAAQMLVRGGTLAVNKTPQPRKVQINTRRFRLWQRDPRCLWCGRVTRIDGVIEQDAATLDHLHPQGQREGRVLPRSVLACRRCNSNRGRPPEPKGSTCPVVENARRAA